MYKLGKRAISHFIRTGCRRRLRLDLYEGKAARRAADAPDKDVGRPGLALLAHQGREYEREKYGELVEVFGGRVVHGGLKKHARGGGTAFEKIELDLVIDNLAARTFALEAEFEITERFIFTNDLSGLMSGRGVAGDSNLAFEDLRPDILQVLPPAGMPRRVVTPSGHLQRLRPEDRRLGLRIIDIKIAGEPSPSHFAELAYYGMALAGWLVDSGRADRFVVLADAAIWPGTHDGSEIRRLLNERQSGNRRVGAEQFLRGLDADLEAMPPEVVLGRVRRFLNVDLPAVLSPAHWSELDWHVGRVCSGCDYLGFSWSRHGDEVSAGAHHREEPKDERYCWPTAERLGHLSRIAGLTEGACGKLREAGVPDVGSVSELAENSTKFDHHQALRAKRALIAARARTLRDRTAATVPKQTGTSAVLPRFADIRISVSADFDVGSGITFAFGYRIDYGVPNASRPRGRDGPRFGRRFRTVRREMLVKKRSTGAEGVVLEKWLERLVRDLHRIRDKVLHGYREHGGTEWTDASLQFFLWDRLTYNHLRRLLGRHLARAQAPVRIGEVDLSPMAWVFPAENVLERPEFVRRSSPITLVADAANSLVSAPIPHHYGVIDLANHLDPESRARPDGTKWSFRVNNFYRDPLSDQIPSERGHELWNRGSPFPDGDHGRHRKEMRRAVRRKLQAVAWAAERLTRELGESLHAHAPHVGDVFRPTQRMENVGNDAQILYQHALLMAAAQRLEVDLLMAMPPLEREARFRSARVDAILEGEERLGGLKTLGIGHLVNDHAVLVFQLSERSREVRMKAGEFNWSFLPEAELPRLQELTVRQFMAQEKNDVLGSGSRLWDWHARRNHKLRTALNVTILGIDRGRRLLAVEANELLSEVLHHELLALDLDGPGNRFGIVDPVETDFFTPRLRKTLEGEFGLRHPPLAEERPLFPSGGVAHLDSGTPNVAESNPPAADFIWNADRLAVRETGEDGTPLLATAERLLPGLTEKQREAIANAVERRLTLWWGPPGTGKSRTAQALLASLAARTVAERRRIRIAITGFTWVAIDNVARRLPELVEDAGIGREVEIHRLSRDGSGRGVDPLLTNCVTSMNTYPSPHDRLAELERRLVDPVRGVTIVASTVDQLFKLDAPNTCSPLFDVLVIDEASQLDIAHAVVAFGKLAPDARVVVIGDDKQMAPIHPIEAPEGHGHLLGSVYDFFRHYRRHEGEEFAISPVMLDRSFRSNREIVSFVREAGYGETLEPAERCANLRIAAGRPLATARPEDWPDERELAFSPHFARILDPEEPLVAVVHDDRYSSQRNEGEARLVAGLVYMLFHARLLDLESGNSEPYSPNDFFRKGLGIVTPHRAQQAAVFERLDAVLPRTFDRNVVFDSVDCQ